MTDLYTAFSEREALLTSSFIWNGVYKILGVFGVVRKAIKIPISQVKKCHANKAPQYVSYLSFYVSKSCSSST